MKGRKVSAFLQFDAIAIIHDHGVTFKFVDGDQRVRIPPENLQLVIEPRGPAKRKKRRAKKEDAA